MNSKIDGETTIHHEAEIENSYNMISYIISKGDDLNIKNSEGKTSFHIASEKNNAIIIQLLKIEVLK